MKYSRYMVFYYESYYPNGGLSDCIFNTDNLEQAKLVHDAVYGCDCIFDRVEGVCVDHNEPKDMWEKVFMVGRYEGALEKLTSAQRNALAILKEAYPRPQSIQLVPGYLLEPFQKPALNYNYYTYVTDLS